MDTVKKELILDGLDCAHCGSKIEEKVGEIEEVHNASLNFITKTLTIETDHTDNLKEIMDKANKLIKKIEPGLIINERIISTSVSNDFIVIGLDCAKCASYIEKEIEKLPEVENVNMEFLQGKIQLEYNEKYSNEKTPAKVMDIIKSTEHDIKVFEGKTGDAVIDGISCSVCDSSVYEEKKLSTERIKFIRIILGSILFLSGIVFNMPPSFEFIMFFTAYIFIGMDVLMRATRNIVKGKVFDENFLMTTATIGAFAIKEFPEAVAVMLFYQIGDYFQSLAVKRSRNSIQELMDIRPDYANIEVNGEIKTVQPDVVKTGDTVIVRPGEKIPLDGLVLEGESVIDTSALTGESLPRDVYPDTEVISGSVNMRGLLKIEVLREFSESTVSRILNLVQNAGSRKAQAENFITKFAKYYTPAVVFSAFLLALLPPLIIEGALFTDWLHRALVFLVVSCPCALVISIPLSFFGGIGGASRNGILIKGSNYLELLNNVKTVVFDKTGTLTEGTFQLTEINTEEHIGEEELLKYAAYGEFYSNHPIALSILGSYGGTVDKEKIKNYDELSGFGVKAKMDGREIIIGNSRIMERENIDFKKTDKEGTVVYAAIDGKYAGNLVISDIVRKDSRKAVSSLYKAGINNIIMLTGDSHTVGDAIGKSLGIENVYSELLPNEKVEKLEEILEMTKTGEAVAFIGDGINDAPVLARADVGVAMGGLGSDAAIEAADIILMTDEPSKFTDAIGIARRTRRIVWQNIAFAFGIKFLVLALGAGGIATMWEAVFADVGVAVIAIFNAMRLIGYKIE